MMAAFSGRATIFEIQILKGSRVKEMLEQHGIKRKEKYEHKIRFD